MSMFTRSRSVALLGVVALALSATVPVHGLGSTAFNTNRLTFSSAVRLPGVTLPAGVYLFERLEPTNRDLIVVRSVDRTRVYFLANTQRADRPVDLPATQFVTLGEARRGEVPPITAWYPQGERGGHVFVYHER